MSRTYRKSAKGQKRAWIKRSRYEGEKDAFYAKNPHRWKDRGDWIDHMSTPSHWVHDMMTKPQRAQTRDLIQKVLKEEVDYDEVSFPLARKPHVYYW